ncbi:hypothetical protein GGR54DRAFT_635669 [Hypoxylon sp. NC1633]|nr:hypothetical protein GGR54DRAFT_635669 [Hypoxylon sp. NC1633]
MAADGGYAPQVCVTCKYRKKKCDKVVPSCGYCIQKKLSCSHQYGSQQSPTIADVRSPKRARTASDESPAGHAAVVVVPSLSEVIPTDPMAMRTNLYLQVNRIIRSTGQFVDDITARYFQGVHHFMPVISRTRFHDNLITLGATPSADFSILLLCICLVTHDISTEDARRGMPDQHSIHVSARSLFAQLQAVLKPSVHFIQAGLLLSVYEYAHGEADTAFNSVASCARMAYAARIHSREHAKLEHDPETNTELEAEEAANTWWGLVILERTIAFEVAVPEQPLITTIPSKDARLPTEPDILEQTDTFDSESIHKVSVSSPITIEVGAFARSAQAAILMDQVLKAFDMPDLKSRIERLEALDEALQAFIKRVMQQRHGKWGIFCGPMALGIRALFAVHRRILSLAPDEIAGADSTSFEISQDSSRSALDTLTNIMIDIAKAHETTLWKPIDQLPTSCAFIICAALEHIRDYAHLKDVPWWGCHIRLLRNSLARFRGRWGN